MSTTKLIELDGDRATPVEIASTPAQLSQAAGQAAGTTPATADMDMGGKVIFGLPTTLEAIVSLSQALSAGQYQAAVTALLYAVGLDAVDLATAAPLPAHTKVGTTLTGNANGQLTIAGYPLTNGDIGKVVVIQNEGDQTHNGYADVVAPGDGGSPFELLLRNPAGGVIYAGYQTKISPTGTTGGQWFRCTAGGEAGTAAIAFERSSPPNLATALLDGLMAAADKSEFDRMRASTPVADADHLVTTAQRYIGYTSLTAPHTVTLPPVATVADGFDVVVKDESGAAGTHNITIDADGVETIDGATMLVISTNYAAAHVRKRGTGWFVV